MLKVERLLSDLRAAQLAAPIPLTSQTPNREWMPWEVREMARLKERGRPVKEIAAFLGRTEHAVEKRLFRYRRGK